MFVSQRTIYIYDHTDPRPVEALLSSRLIRVLFYTSCGHGPGTFCDFIPFVILYIKVLPRD